VDGRKTTRLTEFLDAYPHHVRDVARAVLNAELGKLHMKTAQGIKDDIRQIVEQQAAQMENEARLAGHDQ
jgi:hypothetical protein